MKVVSVRHRFDSVAGAATAVAVAATLVGAPPDQVRPAAFSTQIHAVEFQAVTASAVLNVTDGGSVPPPQNGPRANATASATGSPNLLAVAAGIGLGAVLLPLWYLAAPVTLPMTIVVIAAFGGVCSGCSSGSSNGASNPLANIILPGLQYWLTGPIQGFFGVITSGFASPAASVSRPAGATAAGVVKRKAASARDVRQPRAQAASGPQTRSAAKSKAARPGNATAKRAARSAG